ncbi:MAG: response regulator receiver protein [Bacteroidota bacterium]|nr:response regulator receiver protein [Bacteroidota bacterium]
MKEEKIKILYTDDDQDDRDLFRDALAQTDFKYHLELASNGDEALDKIKEFKPDIIFLDINMPLKCGKECLIEIRKDKRYKNIPVVMISTSMDDSDVDETYNNGANAYIVKQVSFEQQTKLIRLILSMHLHENLSPNSRKSFLISDPVKVSRNLKLRLN